MEMEIEKLTHEEIVELTSEQVERLVKYACAEAGIPLMTRPIEPEVGEEVKPDVKVFQLCGISSTDRSILSEIADFISAKDGLNKMCKLWYEHTGQSVRKLEDYDRRSALQISSDDAFSETKFDEVSGIIKQQQEAKKKYQSDKTEFESLSRQWNNIADGIRRVISVHNGFESDINYHLIKFNEYVELAGGQQDIAMNFWQKAYGTKDAMFATIFKLKVAKDVDFCRMRNLYISQKISGEVAP